VPQINVFSVTNRFNDNKMSKRYFGSMFNKGVKSINNINCINPIFGLHVLFNTTIIRKTDSQFREVNFDMEKILKEKI